MRFQPKVLTARIFQDASMRLRPTVAERMKRWGSRKREVGGHWAWDLRPGTRWDEVIDHDE